MAKQPGQSQGNDLGKDRESDRRGESSNGSDDGGADDGATSFSWDFERDEYAPPLRSALPADGVRSTGDGAEYGANYARQRKLDAARSGTVSGGTTQPNAWKNVSQEHVGKGKFSRQQVLLIRQQLDSALDRWWAVGEVPPLPLLRDGLLLLEAGEPLSESVRTLLLRTALVYDRGIKTALRHQVDLERVALVFAEAGVEWAIPVAPNQIVELVGNYSQLLTLLVGEVERKRALLGGEQRVRADALLAVLPRVASGHNSPPPTYVAAGTGRRGPFRQLLLLLLLVALVGFVLWQQRKVMPAGMVAMPAATYALLPAEDGGSIDAVALGAFFIDRFEVTNRDYRTCVDQGACVWPVRPHSETRRDYFTNPAFDGHPVVEVTQAMATAYCQWQGKRLPSVGEWQAAASVSPVTGQAFRFPWGEVFEVQRANSAASGLGDSVAVGLFRPGGDSPGGVSDMAGNVAEWTSTLVNDGAGGTRAIVKGGSFASELSALAVGSQMYFAVGEGSTTVGFRCARN